MAFDGKQINNMKITLVLLTFVCALSWSCHSYENKNVAYGEVNDSDGSTGSQADSSITAVNRNMIWTVDNENAENEKLKSSGKCNT
jgi:hypothetical protein